MYNSNWFNSYNIFNYISNIIIPQITAIEELNIVIKLQLHCITYLSCYNLAMTSFRVFFALYGNKETWRKNQYVYKQSRSAVENLVNG